jgi:hypothetical protein
MKKKPRRIVIQASLNFIRSPYEKKNLILISTRIKKSRKTFKDSDRAESFRRKVTKQVLHSFGYLTTKSREQSELSLNFDRTGFTLFEQHAKLHEASGETLH